MTTHKPQDSDHEDYDLTDHVHRHSPTGTAQKVRDARHAAIAAPAVHDMPRAEGERKYPLGGSQDSDLSDYEGVLETVTGSSEAERIARSQKHNPKARTPVEYDPHGAKPVLDTSEEARKRRLHAVTYRSGR